MLSTIFCRSFTLCLLTNSEPTKMTSKDDINGLVSIKFLRSTVSCYYKPQHSTTDYKCTSFSNMYDCTMKNISPNEALNTLTGQKREITWSNILCFCLANSSYLARLLEDFSGFNFNLNFEFSGKYYEEAGPQEKLIPCICFAGVLLS